MPYLDYVLPGGTATPEPTPTPDPVQLLTPTLIAAASAVTANSITLEAVTAQTGGTANYAISYDSGSTWNSWQTSATFTGLNGSTAYQFKAKYVATDTTNYSDSPESNVVTISTAAENTVVKLTAPTLSQTPAAKDSASITLAVPPGSAQDASATLQYRCALAQTGADAAAMQAALESATWRDSNIFTGLTANTVYWFQARYFAVTTASWSDSDPSTAVSISTTTVGNAITIAGSIANGDITAPTEAQAGATVAVTLTPAAGYQPVAGSLTYQVGTAAPVRIVTNGGAPYKYTFQMPASPVTITAQFEPIPQKIIVSDPAWRQADLTIYTAEDLFAFAKRVNDNESFEGKIVRLACDIDLKNAAWTPIGYYGTDPDNASGMRLYYFKGDFDGNGFTISGLNVSAAGVEKRSYLGLFSAISGATIRNLTVYGRVDGSIAGISGSGGIVGMAYKSVVQNCVNYAEVISQARAGGIQANCLATQDGAPTEAIGGIYNCKNYAQIVSTTNSADIGGIAGTAFIVENCVNYGSVTATKGDRVANSSIGGIVGSGYSAGIGSHVTGCVNNGAVSGPALNMGGIAGSNTVVYDCYNTANVTNTGDDPQSNHSNPPLTGGIIGLYGNVTIRNTEASTANERNYNTGIITANGLDGMAAGITVIPKGGLNVERVESYGFASVAPLRNAFNLITGKLWWEDAAPSYTVTFTGGTANVNGASGLSSTTLPQGHYTYTGSNGASGEFWVNLGDKTVALAADVTFAGSQGITIEVKNSGGTVVSGASGVYAALPNGTYTYTAALGSEVKASGTFLVAGADRTISLPDITSDRVSVTFDVNEPGADILVKDSSGTPVDAVSGIYSLIKGAQYTYTVNKYCFVPKSDSFTASADRDFEIELKRQIITAQFDFISRDAVMTVTDVNSVPVEPYHKDYPSGSQIFWQYYFEMGMPYTYKLTYNGKSISDTVTYYSDHTLPIALDSLKPDNPDIVVAPWEPDTSWYTAGEPYIIRTPQQLAGLAKLVNDGNNLSGKTVKLGNNIDLENKPWTPIGSFAKPFAGTFDGGGYDIVGLYINRPGFSYAALFACSTGTLKDFTVHGEINAASSVAGVAAQASGTVTGITNYVKLTASGDFVGGIVADAIGYIKLDDCHNRGEITHTDREKSTGRAGGIIGRVDNGEWSVEGAGYTVKASADITNCSNMADILAYQYVGGIIGGQFGAAHVKFCFNSGKITGVSFGKVYIGGISGKCEGGTIDSCYNIGEIYCSHWSAGHVRAIGGIAGSEEGRTNGTTAITNCYNTGLISFYSDNIGTSGVYAVANISGGNQVSDANGMRYSDCFYLEGKLPQGSPTHADYKYWATVYKNNNLAYDTTFTTKVTSAELQSAQVLAKLNSSNSGFVSDSHAINNGYPILYWQAGATAPIGQEYAVGAPSVIGGTGMSTASTDVSKAIQGTTVTVNVSPESGKRVYSVTVTDTAGGNITVTKSTDAIYTFVMPGRAVTITVVLENDAAVTDKYFTLTLPTGLDPIWSVTGESSGFKDGKYAAGSTVFIMVSKAANAKTASVGGLTLNPTATLTAISTGYYSFTMPENDVSVTLIEQYSTITVSEQVGASGTPVTKATYTRAQMIDLAVTNVLYSGWSTESLPMLGRADQAVTLTRLLAQAGVSFKSGDTLRLKAVDNAVMDFTYDELLGVTRYYYPNILTGSDTGKTELHPFFVVKGNAAEGNSAIGDGDMLNTYRFIFGQSVADFTGHVKSGDKQPKWITSVTVIKQGDTIKATTPTVSGGVATASVTGTEVLQDQNVTLEMKATGSVSEMDISIEADTLIALKNAEASLTLQTSLGTLTFDSKSLEEAARDAGIDGVELIIKRLTTSTDLTINELLKNGAAVYELHLKNIRTGAEIFTSETNLGSVTLTVPYTRQKAGNAIKVYHLKSASKLEVTGVTSASSTVTFRTSHFSVFSIEEVGGGNRFATVWDGQTIDIEWFTKNPSAASFTINTPAELAGLAALVNGLYNKEIDTVFGDATYLNCKTVYGTTTGNSNSTATYHYGVLPNGSPCDFAGKTITLGADINMGSSNYMPIGGQYLMTPNDSTTKISSGFNGVFDGKGHNITINCERNAGTVNYGDGQSVGLIGRLGIHDNDPVGWKSSVAVRNVAVYGSVYANRSVGGIVGKIGMHIGDAVIENCANFASVRATDAKGVGGICGAAWNGGIIRNCYNSGTISESHTSPAGGIVGSAEVRVENCFNVGKVTAPKGYAMAIGTNNGGATQTNCYYLSGSAVDGGWYTGGSSGSFDKSGERLSEFMKSGDILKLIGSAFTTDNKTPKNSGYPILLWQSDGTAPSATIKPNATVSGSTAAASVTAEEVTKALEAAKSGSTTAVTIIPQGTGSTTDIQVNVPTSSLNDIYNAGKSLTIETTQGNLTYNAAALSKLYQTTTGNTVTFGVKKLDLINGDKAFELYASSGTQKLTELGSGSVAVNLPYTLKSGEMPGNIKVYLIAADGTKTEASCQYDKTTGMVTFTATKLGTYTIHMNTEWVNPFSDVKSGDWFFDAVKYVNERGLMVGTDGTHFDPNGNMTRAMLVTVLYRMMGDPVVTISRSKFSDVPNGQWYSDAVEWAETNGIVLGYGDGTFGTNDLVTREQMVTIFYRCAQTHGHIMTMAAPDISKFTDSGSVSSWALSAMKWSVTEGIIEGRTATTLAPQGSSTRAEAATVIMRFNKTYE